MGDAFTAKDLEMIVHIAGKELESENRAICESFKTNPALSGNTRLVPGIKLLENEWYYQRVVYRGLLKSFPYAPILEYEPGEFDIALFKNASFRRDEQPIALGEMKDDRYEKVTPGGPLVREIERDIGKLNKRPHSGQFLLIFTIVPKGGLDKWVEEVLEMVKCSDREHYECQFDTANDDKGKIECDGWVFAVVGILLKAAP
jgi:hypothetical protein